MIWTITSAFKSNQELYDGSLSPLPKDLSVADLAPTHWGQLVKALHLDNFSRAWYTASFAQYFFNTLIFSVAVALLVTLLCALTGYVLGRYSFPGKTLIITAITVTTLIPHGYTIIPLWQIIKGIGLNNSMAGIILAESGGTHLLYILLFMGYFSSFPKALEDAADIDGAGFIRVFATVMLPLAKPIIATTILLHFVNAWNSFFIPLVFTLNRPELRTLGVGMLSFVGQNSSDLVGMAAGATISLVPIIIVFIIFQRHIVSGLAGAVKG